MILFSIRNGDLILDFLKSELSPIDKNQIQFLGFERTESNFRLAREHTSFEDIVVKVTNYLSRKGVVYGLSKEVQILIEKKIKANRKIFSIMSVGKSIKDGKLNKEEYEEFVGFLQKNIKRQLKDYQVKAAFHLFKVVNGANFSVPGSGKTAVVLSVFQKLRSLNIVDALFVVGPPACFAPWIDEYKEVLGDNPKDEILAGGDKVKRHSKYFSDRNSVSDIYLTSFHTLHRDWEKVISLFSLGARFFLVIDEAHYIKQQGGAWAAAVLHVAEHAEKRCVLTGTPFPYSYTDAFNLFDLLWPENSPISAEKKHRITKLAGNNQLAEASEILDTSVGPLFYRVRKSELNLARQVFEEPIMVQMKDVERQVYDRIFDNLRAISKKDYFRDLETLMVLRRGRMMRLRQCLSYIQLLNTAIEGFDEDFYQDDESLASLIRNYDDLESPGKLQVLIGKVKDIHASGQKVVIWSNFVKTLKLIKKSVSHLGIKANLIYGDTPFQNADAKEGTREEIIKDFVHENGSTDVLVANPAACAESISLHKTCSHAIYYDLSYNCAQYMQSLDRIHRIGGSENKESFYYFLQYKNTFEEDILSCLQSRENHMKQIVDQDYPIYSMDMFSDDDGDDEAYERLFKQS